MEADESRGHAAETFRSYEDLLDNHVKPLDLFYLEVKLFNFPLQHADIQSGWKFLSRVLCVYTQLKVLNTLNLRKRPCDYAIVFVLYNFKTYNFRIFTLSIKYHRNK